MTFLAVIGALTIVGMLFYPTQPVIVTFHAEPEDNDDE